MDFSVVDPIQGCHNGPNLVLVGDLAQGHRRLALSNGHWMSSSLTEWSYAALCTLKRITHMLLEFCE